MKIFTRNNPLYKLVLPLLLFSLILLIFSTPIHAAAEGTKEMTIGDFNVTYWPMDYYATGWEGVTINSYIGKGSHVTFPEKLGGYDVMYGINMIDQLPDFVTSVKLENNVSITEFWLPKNLSSLTLPNTPMYSTFIGLEDTPYYKNKNNWSNGLLYCGKHLLAVDDNYSGELAIKNGTLSIEYTALENMPNVTSVIFPGSLKNFSYVGKGAPGVSGAKLKELVFCEGMQDVVISTGSNSNTPIEKIVLPDSLKTVYLSMYSHQTPSIYCSTGNTAAIKCAQENKLSIVYKQREAILKSSINVNITVKYSNNTLFDIGTAFISEILDFSKLNQKIRNDITSTNVTAYDFSLEIFGNKCQPSNRVTVSVPVPAGYNSSQITVYHVFSNNEIGKVNAIIKNGIISFETDSFSTFLIVDESSSSGVTGTTSHTPASTSTSAAQTTSPTGLQTSTENSGTTTSGETDKSTKAADTDPSGIVDKTSNASGEKKETPSSLIWLWVALGLLLIGGGTAMVLYLIKSGKIRIKQSKNNS